MAGLSFLYAFMNLYTMGGGEGVPTLEEAMVDIGSCLSTLEYLSRELILPDNRSAEADISARVPSAGACHDTMRQLSQSILEQLGSPSSAPQAPTAASLRNLSRAAPISSSRDDPLPNSDYLAPLPSVTLPYEVSLLDNLFINPMATHQKASDYTNGAKNRAGGTALTTLYSQNGGNSNPGVSTASLTVPNPYGSGLGAYQLAAQVRAGYTDCPTIEQSLAGGTGNGNTNQSQSFPQMDAKDNNNSANVFTGQESVSTMNNQTDMGNTDTMGDLGILLGAMDGQHNQPDQPQIQTQTLQGLGDNAAAFDFFSFLDEGFGQDAGFDGMALWS